LIRVHREGVELYRNILIQPGEPRPEFYPSDIPFAPRAFCNATWSTDFGFAVLWSLPVETLNLPNKEQVAALGQFQDADAAEEFVRRFLAAAKEDKLRMVQELSQLSGESFMRRIDETFGDSSEDELPADAQTLTADLITFHLRAGWEVAQDSDQRAPGHSWTLTRGERRRQLSAYALFGMSTATLAEKKQE